MLIAFNKPFGVLSQFTSDGSKNRALAEFGFPKDTWPIGRLDADSEGLLLLSDESALNARLLQPRQVHEREYWAQVERVPSAESLKKLEGGVMIEGRKTLPCRAWMLETQPVMAPRVPPIRYRKSVADCWIGLELVEGKNRQVRKMTAAIGHPTLRLMRVRIGNFWLGDLPQGQWKILSCGEYEEVLGADKHRLLARNVLGLLTNHVLRVSRCVKQRRNGKIKQKLTKETKGHDCNECIRILNHGSDTRRNRFLQLQ